MLELKTKTTKRLQQVKALEHVRGLWDRNLEAQKSQSSGFSGHQLLESYTSFFSSFTIRIALFLRGLYPTTIITNERSMF